ncbi:MAG TPA: DR2241 family protein, partial [Chthoniobacterales bacterium]|nr:DR2241 family protein [Chthoniobacterales bacterium]
MRDLIEELFNTLGSQFQFGQILIQKRAGSGYVLSHREDASLHQLPIYRNAQDAVDIAKSDDRGNYRPLKTAPNLQRGWRLEVANVDHLRRALDYFYPGRLAV